MSLPPFQDSFSYGVVLLYEATNKTSLAQRYTLLMFLNDYGTHFVTQMFYGAKVSETQKYSEYTTQQVGREALEECTTK